MIQFHLDPRSGVSTYLQLVHQVRHAVRLGMLRPGDQLPTVKEAVASLAINPNTVLKAYRELEREGVTEARRGQGTFISTNQPAAVAADYTALRAALVKWVERARKAGLDEEGIDALISATLHAVFFEEAA